MMIIRLKERYGDYIIFLCGPLIILSFLWVMGHLFVFLPTLALLGEFGWSGIPLSASLCVPVVVGKWLEWDLDFLDTAALGTAA